MKLFYTSIFNLFNSLLKARAFYKTAEQFDIFDITVNVFYEKVRDLNSINLKK
jgi:hypothetical protein